MAVVLIEGFDHLTASQMTSKGWSATADSTPAGRHGGQAFRINAGSNRSKTLPSSYATLIAGVAFTFTNLPGSTQDILILQAGGTQTFRLGITSAGRLTLRNSSGTVIATGTTVLNVNIWYQVQVKVFINGASGTGEVRLNGVAGEIPSTTGNFGSSNIDTITIATSGFSGHIDFDDLYAVDTTGAAPRNTFLGDVRVGTLYPTGAGAHTAWTPDSGSNYARVNAAQADDDTSYVSSSNPGDIDTYACGDVDTAATVFAVQTNLYARKDDAGARQIAPIVRQSGADNVGATVTLTSSYVDYTQIYNQDPASADWTPTTVNADEFGVKEIA